MDLKNIILYKRKNHLYSPVCIPFGLSKGFIHWFGSVSTGDHGKIIVELAFKSFGSIMSVVSGRQRQIMVLLIRY